MTGDAPRARAGGPRGLAIVLVATAVVAALAIALRGGGSASGPTIEVLRDSQDTLPATPTVLASMTDGSREQLTGAVLRAMAGLEIVGAEEARRVGVEYVLSLADFSADRAWSLGEEIGAGPDPEFMAQQRVVLASIPDRIKPEGWERFDDRDLVYWAFSMLRLARWDSVDHETIRATRFEKGRTHAALDAYFMMNPPPGYERSGSSQPIFPMLGLIHKARMSLVDVVMLEINATLERGDEQRFRILLAEYEPGKWYPAGYRSDIVRVPSLHGATRAPRPR